MFTTTHSGFGGKKLAFLTWIFLDAFIFEDFGAYLRVGLWILIRKFKFGCGMDVSSQTVALDSKYSG